jgi:hypothetical protein
MPKLKAAFEAAGFYRRAHGAVERQRRRLTTRQGSMYFYALDHNASHVIGFSTEDGK